MDVSRGSLAWLWRQTHDLESINGASPEVAGSNPAPGTRVALEIWSLKHLSEIFSTMVTFLRACWQRLPAVWTLESVSALF
jgi:hypothetical protein